MSRITDEQMEEVSILAKLSLNGEEKEKVREDLSRLLDYMEILKEADTEGISPEGSVSPSVNVFREDVCMDSGNAEELLFNAPEQKNGCFLVPRTI